ncbi:MAG: InlB B-repeat-containing protein [Fibromonadaceae bacterium]|nr:InlB B-repeat-containing protein [Fibromonadaceae bacterium]
MICITLNGGKAENENKNFHKIGSHCGSYGAMLVVLAGCSGNDDERISTDDYTVTYNGNGNTGGTAPVDTNSPYLSGATVTVLSEGSLVKTGYTFNGWNTAIDGNGASYVTGNKFDITANTILYAKWTELPKYTVTYNGNGNTGGTAPVDANSPYLSGATVTVLNEGSLVKTGYKFGGWNISPTGTGASYISGASFTMLSNDLTLYAWWQELIDDPADDPTDNTNHINRFQAMPYAGNDKIKYSYSHDGYDFYYIYLGELRNIPMFYLDAQYFGTTAEMTYTFATTEIETNTIRNTVSNSSQQVRTVTDQYTNSKTTSQKVSTEISAKIKVPIVSDFGVKASGERNWSQLISNSQTNVFQRTTSLTNTTERVTTFTTENRFTFSWPLAKSKGDREGWYRYTLFSASDTYLYVIKDATGVVYYEFKEHVKPDVTLGWMLDYSETLSFEKSDASSFEFDVSMLDDLPKPELEFLHGFFIDPRDDQVYRTIRIGDQVWMAENLNYNVNGAICYSNRIANCNIYGRLYNWNTARTICPSGWHLPSNAEWWTLVYFVGTESGRKLKAKSGWNNDYQGRSGNGTDDFGFSALPGGSEASGSFYSVGIIGNWWSATEDYNYNYGGVDGAFVRDMGVGSNSVGSFSIGKAARHSVRCLRD